MGQTPDYYSSSMRATLAATLPGLSCEIGTPERKIIDAVAEAISEASVSQYLTGSLLDIDTKGGLELDQFVGLFGIGRQQGQPASGLVHVTMGAPPSTDVNIPLGTQFYTTPNLPGLTTQLYYSSTQAVVISAGLNSVDVPVQCTTVGSAGNVPPDSITFLGSIVGATSVTNLVPMTGGTDAESDTALRQRFKDTLLRNSVGTTDFYVALCQQNVNVHRVGVYGANTVLHTQATVPGLGGVITLYNDATVDVAGYYDSVKWIWNNRISVSSGLGTTDEVMYSPDTDYTFTGNLQDASIAINSQSSMVPGDVVDVEVQYVSTASRNTPGLVNPQVNKVDIYVDGMDPVSVTETLLIPTVAQDLFSTDTTSMFYYGNFAREDGTQPSTTSRFMRIGSVPIVSFPSTITSGSTTYSELTDYYLVHDVTPTRGSIRETSGVEWVQGAGPGENSQITLSYAYNRTPQLLQAVIDQAKQLTTDVLVHQAQPLCLVVCLYVEYGRAYSPQTVNTAIISRLQTYMGGISYGSTIRTGNVLLAVMQVKGVVDASILTQDAATTDSHGIVRYGIQAYDNLDNTVDPGATYTSDFKMLDAQVPILLDTVIVRRPTR